MCRATFICQYGLCCCNMALVSFRLFRKNLSNSGDFFWANGLPPAPPPPPGEKIPVRLWSRLFQGFNHTANYTICIYIDTRDNHQILSRSQPARAFYCTRARHCIVGNNNAATHHKPYTCHKSTVWAPTAQGTRAKRANAIPDWHLTTETGNGLCERLNKGPFIWLLRGGGGIGDLVCIRIFFPTTGGKTFSPDIQSHCMAGVSMQDFFRSKSVFYLLLLKKQIKQNSASQQFT